MADRQSILGFTEAELGFFLVLLCVVLWAASALTTPVPKPVPNRANITRDSLVKLQVRLAQLEGTVDSLRRVVDSLRSPIWPSCISRGLSSGTLLTAVVIGAGLFRVERDTLDIKELARRTARARVRANAAECREEVRFQVRRDLNASESEAARRSIDALGLRIVSGPSVER